MDLVFFLFVVIVLPFSIFVHVLVRMVFYAFMRMRNSRVESLARGFGLSFTSELPSYWKFLWIFRDIAINNIEGVAQGHRIAIRDCYRLSFKDPLRRYGRFTWVEIDGKLITERYNSFTPSSFLLNTTYELRKLLSQDLQPQSK